MPPRNIHGVFTTADNMTGADLVNMQEDAETPIKQFKNQNKVKISLADSLLQTCVQYGRHVSNKQYEHYGCNARARIRDVSLEDFLCARSVSAKPKAAAALRCISAESPTEAEDNSGWSF